MPTKVVEQTDLTPAVQDYAKAIYALEGRAGVASTNALAERLGVRPGSVSGMLRKLDALGLVVHERYRGVRLTESGRRVALEVMRHHRLLELYLAESLGMGWDQVHAEAERLEHVHLGEAGGGDRRQARQPDASIRTAIRSPTRKLAVADVPSESLYELEPGATGHLRQGVGFGPGDAAFPGRACGSRRATGSS